MATEDRSSLGSVSRPETLIGDTDSREQVHTLQKAPFKWIASLQIEYEKGKPPMPGTAFEMHTPFRNTRVILTAGHCVWDQGFYPRVTMTFPGCKPVVVDLGNCYVSPKYHDTKNKDHDYALIHLPGEGNEGFGWSTELTDKELMDCCAFICGHPGDKPEGTQWKSEGRITDVTQHRLSYEIDTSWGQSGSPIYIDKEDYTAVGVHGYGDEGKPNHGPRLNLDMLSDLIRGISVPKMLNSVLYGGIYVRCDGLNVVQCTANRSGTVSARCGVGDDGEFFIYPILKPSSRGAQKRPETKYVIESAKWKGVYLRLDGQNMREYEENGGGVVNCQRGAGPAEQFYFECEGEGDEIYSITSVKFPNCRMRIEGKWFAGTRCIRGNVNCQFYADATIEPAKNCERFLIVPAH